MSVSVQAGDFDAGKEIAALRADTHEVGAVASFIGVVRQSLSPSPLAGEGRGEGGHSPVGADETPSSQSLTLEHYPGMTEAALKAIVAQANERWNLHKVRVIHRVGKLQLGDQIVFVGVASAHRGEAFAACEFIMDFLKTEAPFWKKEADQNGTHWVDAKDSDELAAARWS